MFVAALTVLPPRQRAALITRDLLEYSAAETAALLDVSVASANSLTMPPEAPCIGKADAAAFFRHLLSAEGPGEWLLVPTRANGQPATANYLRRPGDSDHRALSIDVLTIHHHRLTAVNCFLGDRLFSAFGLPTRR